MGDMKVDDERRRTCITVFIRAGMHRGMRSSRGWLAIAALPVALRMAKSGIETPSSASAFNFALK